MTDREKLTKLILNHTCLEAEDDNCGGHHDCSQCIADYLIAEGVTFQTWIPVTERLPEKMCQCICRYVFGENTEYPFYQVLWYFTLEEKPHFQNEGSMGLRVTHWLPLPEPPKEE